MNAKNANCPKAGGQYTFAEIGKELGISAQAARQYYLYALRKLAKARGVKSMAKMAADLEFAREQRLRGSL